MRAILEGATSTPDQPGVSPGGVLSYGDDGREVTTMAWGMSHVIAPGGNPAMAPVTADTIYDLASITKAVVTAALLMKLRIDVDQPVAKLLPELRGDGKDLITFAHLLGHASGFPAHIKFYERLLAGERSGAASAREALLRMVGQVALVRPPGQATEYSDLGYITLGFAIERLTGQRLDVCFRELIAEPLGMNDSFFVDLTGQPEYNRAPHGADRDGNGINTDSRVIAPTEVCPYRGLVHGQVHDDNAHAAGGIVGHAGLFGTAGDLGRFARAIMRAWSGQTEPVGFDPATVRRFWSTSSAPDTTWRLGWDRPSPPPVATHAGDLWPRDGVGHLGFTGTSLWLDPPRARYVVLLTNRVHPGRDNAEGIRALRRAVMDQVVGTLEARDPREGPT
ncbi:MAG: serine hydrolase domain-containing protein [Myxococcota bacterium]